MNKSLFYLAIFILTVTAVILASIIVPTSIVSNVLAFIAAFSFFVLIGLALD